jgi:vesicle-associated membrane protein 7
MAGAGSNVRLATYARLSDGLALATFKSRAANAATEETAGKVLTSGNLKPNAQLTVTVTPEIGTLHLAAGETDVVAVIAAPEYPRRSAFKLLDEIRGQVREAGITAEDVAAATKALSLKSSLPFLRDACIRYDDLAEVDKLTAVGAQVEEVNINRMLDNQETVGAIEDKSEAMRAGAQQFQRRSDTVRRMMWWRLVKLKLIFATLVLCILGYIIIPIIVSANKD